MQKANKILKILKEFLPEPISELNYENIYQLTVAVILSAQTTDVAVNKVTPALFRRFPDFQALATADFLELKEIIKTIGLAPTKTRNLISLSKQLLVEKAGEIPADFDYLITLPGIGRKTANVILSEGFKIPRIAVDTHVLRVSNRLGLIASQKPKEVELKLMELYPSQEWHQLHLRLILFGRYYCKAKKPQCSICPLTAYCHYYTNSPPQ